MIKDVKLILSTDNYPGTKIQRMGQDHFLVTDEDGNEMTVPHDPANRHYQEVKEWYDSKKGLLKKKPFKFDFENAKPE